MVTSYTSKASTDYVVFFSFVKYRCYDSLSLQCYDINKNTNTTSQRSISILFTFKINLL